MDTVAFCAPTHREAMRLLRQSLGPDALIVSSRRTPGGVEVTAVPGEATPPAPPAVAVASADSAPDAGAGAGAGTRAGADAGVSADASAGARAGIGGVPGAGAALAPGEVLGAIDALRGALESRMDGLLWGRSPVRAPAAASLFRTLLGAGFSTALARALAERLPAGLDPAAGLRWARGELVSHLPVARGEKGLPGGAGVYALVGPTGSGKTTTVAKLAARCAARVGADGVAMLTADGYRIGAHEQLQIYGRLMGVPVHAVRDAGGLRRALDRLRGRRVVLIDNVGISQRDRHVAEQAAMLCAAGRPVRRLLVLNASSQGDTLDEVAHAYRHGGGEDVIGCIITKTDEATHLGAALDTAIRHRLPVHYVSGGQKVPEDLAPADAGRLVDQALAGAGPGRTLYAPTEADLAALCEVAGRPRAVPADRGARRRLLRSALAGRGAQSGPARAEFDAALDWLYADAACAAAREAWKDYVRAEPAATAAQRCADLVARTRRAHPDACGRYLLATHGRAALGAAGPGAVLAGALLLGDRGTALAAPAQQLAQAAGTVASCGGEAGPGGRAAPVAALLARIDWLEERFAGLPLAHIVEAGPAALWGPLSQCRIAWLARCPGSLRVACDDGPTTLLALSRGLAYARVPDAGADPASPGRDGGPCLAACARVALPWRGAPGLSLRMVAVRRPAGAPLFGLSPLDDSQATTAELASWLVLHWQARESFRLMAGAWESLGSASGGGDAALRRVLTAGQLGAAAWRISRASDAAGVRSLMAAMMGGASRLAAGMAPAALQRLFAALEMAEAGEAA